MNLQEQNGRTWCTEQIAMATKRLQPEAEHRMGRSQIHGKMVRL